MSSIAVDVVNRLTTWAESKPYVMAKIVDPHRSRNAAWSFGALVLHIF